MDNPFGKLVKELETYIVKHSQYIENFYVKEKHLNEKWKGFKMPLDINKSISSSILNERVALMKDFLNYTITVNKDIMQHIDNKSSNNFYIPLSAKNKRSELNLIQEEITILIKQINENENNIDSYTNLNNLYARSSYINKWAYIVFVVTKDILKHSKYQQSKIIKGPD